MWCTNNCTLCPHCIYLRTNSDLCHLQHKLIGFYNRDLTLYSPVVTVCTASLTFNNSTFCPHTVFMCFVWISEQTAIISLYNINWLVFITKLESVYCAVRTGSSNLREINLSPVPADTPEGTVNVKCFFWSILLQECKWWWLSATHSSSQGQMVSY